MITESDAKKFQILYEKETGEKISLKEAFEISENLVELVRSVYKPIKKRSDMCTKNKSAI
jgi:hypothetical protein